MDRATSSHRLAGSGLRKFTLDFVIVIIFKNAKNCKWLQDFIIVISFQIIYVVTNIFFAFLKIKITITKSCQVQTLQVLNQMDMASVLDDI